MLQRGRARAGAELWQVTALSRRAAHIASTGPRPRGRGISTVAGTWTACDVELQRGRARAGAEFSTRSASRGDASTCFNGAAPARARNSRMHAVAPTSASSLQRGRARAGAEFAHQSRGRSGASGQCFNGAAPARARNWRDLASVGEHARCELQRGRARAGAELRIMRYARDGAIAMLDASTGPRPRGRGIAVVSAMRCCHCAASTGPRPRGRGISDTARIVPASSALQRGRARAGAEFMPTAGRRAHGTASTGPRPRGRGIRIDAARRGDRCSFNGAAPARARNWHMHVQLQRGRAWHRRLSLTLQRGRARAGAELSSGRSSRRIRSRASTGPRPRGRGIGHRTAKPVHARVASTGPRPRGRGIHGTQAQRRMRRLR